MSDSIQHALEQLHSIGLLVDRADLAIDGRLHRVDVEGQKRGKKAGWYTCTWLRLDDGREVVVGAYGVWAGSENQAQKLRFDGASRISDDERRRFKEAQEAAAKAADEERAGRAAEASTRAQQMWRKLPDTGRSPYLQRKGVHAHGLRFGRDGTVVVPLGNEAGLLVGLQFINGDGDKKFLTGTAKRGAWHQIGEVQADTPLVLAEGYATAASIHEATGWPVAVCFDCGNLMPVAKTLKLIFPGVPLLVAGDDDHQKPENAGREHATLCARKLGCSVVFPRFQDANGRTDFNDLQQELGQEEVAAQLKAAWSPPAPEPGPAELADPDAALWSRDLIFTDSGLKPCLQNVMTILLHREEWKGLLAYNEFAKRIVLRRRPPYPRRDGARSDWLSDTDEIEIAAWFGRKDTYRASITTAMVREAAVAVAERNPFHPVREYLRSLKWDGEPRLATFFSDFCGVSQGAAVAAYGRNFFLQAVARVFRPGCKADLMLVLEGAQGSRKSTLAETLAGAGFYADVGTAPSDKDFFQIIQGVWLVEISEMASFARAESSHIKRAITVATDRYRKSYGHNVEDFKRECIFFGTVNPSDWQRDETGGRRYMPVLVGEIDIEAVAAARDQLWAEAVALFDAGEPWHMLPDEAREEQAALYVEDVWAQPVARWLAGKSVKERYRTEIAAPIQETTISELLWRVLDMEVKKQGRSEQTRMGYLLRRMGWRMQQRLEEGARIRYYLRPPAKEE